MKSSTRRAASAAFLVALAWSLAGCEKKMNLTVASNMLPTVRLTAAPIDTNTTCRPDPARSCYSLTLNWVGYDPDGRVDHYRYAVDPPDPDQGDTTWIDTNDSEKRLVFEAPAQANNRDSLNILRGHHTFVVVAVDNRGAVGPRAYRSFFSFTTAPEVTITSPRPLVGVDHQLAPVVRINWRGTDLDGVFTTKPVRYRYLLLGPNNDFPGGLDAIRESRGAAIRRYYAPEFSLDLGWKEVGGDTTSVQFTNLVPGSKYLFTVVGFDEAGAFSPVFAYDKNIVTMLIGYASTFGPRITMFNESFFYQYAGATYRPGLQAEALIEVPAFQPITFYWFAEPPPGADVNGYRWMLDGDVFDETPRSDEQTDLSHWSSSSLSDFTATVGPFNDPREHNFYIEASDNTGLKSLGIIHFQVVVATFDKPLLVVDDCRYRPDNFNAAGQLESPAGRWPSAAEIDTFLYAMGGYPWKQYPPGSISPPGILKGYPFDTVGTRIGLATLGVPLAKLSQYRHVIWITDFSSALNVLGGEIPTDPMTALRYMSVPGHLNTLAAYVRQGGDLWAMGSGVAYASNISYNDNSNDAGGRTVFSPVSTRRELAPGRFMFDVARWQTEIRVVQASRYSVQRQLGRYRGNPGVYGGLPATLAIRTRTSDPLPPMRSDALFYYDTFPVEILSAAGGNDIREPVVGEPSDFVVDAFDDDDAAAIPARWKTTDTLNTLVFQDDVGDAPGSRASGQAMRIQTQGGGASTGDTVALSFGEFSRDWSGLQNIRVSVKQDQPTTNVQWRMRLIDIDGNSATALINVPSTNQWVNVTIPGGTLTPGSTAPIDILRLAKVQFELVRGDAAGSTWFDSFDITTLLEGSTLDTLMAAVGTGIPSNQINATMTSYRGHEFVRPVLFSGFAPWTFQRAQCKALFDFVLQSLWGLSPSGAAVASQRPGTSPARAATSPGRAALIGARGAPASTPQAAARPGVRDLKRRGAELRQGGR